MTSTANIIRTARTSYAALRRLTGSTGATYSAQARHDGIIATATAALLERGEKALVGLLVQEDQLAERLTQARAYNQQRPELAAHLLATRREIRKALTS